MNKKIHDPINITIGNRMRIARIELGMSQSDVAKPFGISHQQIQKYEKGMDSISANKLLHFAKFTKKPVAYFFDIEEINDNVASLESMDSTSLLSLSQALSLLNAKQCKAFIDLVSTMGEKNDTSN